MARHNAVVREIRTLLVERFPLTFMPKGEIKKPLKLGIHRDLRDALQHVPRWMIGVTLSDYVSGTKYLSALIAGAPRYALDGTVAGEVSAEAAEHAAASAAKQREDPAARAAARAKDLGYALAHSGADLGDERSSVLCLIAAGYRAREIEPKLTDAIERARAIRAGALLAEIA